MTEHIDKVLKNGLLEPPADFAARVMAEIALRPMPAPARKASGVRDVVEWLAVGGAVLVGASQLATFLFGIWTFTATG